MEFQIINEVVLGIVAFYVLSALTYLTQLGMSHLQLREFTFPKYNSPPLCLEFESWFSAGRNEGEGEGEGEGEIASFFFPTIG